MLTQLALAWLQRPFTVSVAQRAKLDRLAVAAVVPCYNEDPAILDRTISSLFAQTRPLDWVIVVDDGSTEDYTGIQARWEANPSEHPIRLDTPAEPRQETRPGRGVPGDSAGRHLRHDGLRLCAGAPGHR